MSGPVALQSPQLHAVMTRNGAPAGLRPGQTVAAQVMALPARADQVGQVLVAGRTLQALLPAGVSAGQQLQAKVVQIADGQLGLRWVARDGDRRGQGPDRPTPPRTLMRLTGPQAEQLRGRLSDGARVPVTLVVTQDGPRVSVSGRVLDDGAVSDRVRDAVGRAGGEVIARVRLTDTGEVLLTQPSSDRAQGRAERLRRHAGQLLADPAADPQQVRVALHEAAAASEVPVGAYGPDGSTQPQPGRGGDAQAAVFEPGLLAGWAELPDGRQASFRVGGRDSGGQAARQQASSSFRLVLHGVHLGPVQIDVQAGPVASVTVSVDAEHRPWLAGRAGELQQAVSRALGTETLTQVLARDSAQQRPRSPEGFSVYG